MNAAKRVATGLGVMALLVVAVVLVVWPEGSEPSSALVTGEGSVPRTPDAAAASTLGAEDSDSSFDPVSTTTLAADTASSLEPTITSPANPDGGSGSTPPSTEATQPDKPVQGFDAVVRPGESIQAVVDGLAEGARVLIGAGVHLGQSVRPKAGMVFVGESGAVLDGQGSVEHAFFAPKNAPVDDVTIAGLEIRDYAPDPAFAAVSSFGSGWVVEDCDIHGSGASGIRVTSGSVVRDCHLHHNEKLGLRANGSDILVVGNEISFNNANGAFDPNWEAGGFKFGALDGVVIRDNHIHDNGGHGIWADVDSINILYEGNLIEDNMLSAINHEISYDSVIRNNTIRNNGHGDTRGWLWGAGIQIRGPNVAVYGNVLESNKNGIVLIQTGRGSGKHGSYDLRDVHVYDNVIINSGLNGGGRGDSGSTAIFETSRFEGNEYHYKDINGQWWMWDDGRGDKTFWQSRDQDPDGTFTTG